MSAPGAGEVCETGRTVVITWPRPRPGIPVFSTEMTVQDAESGEKILDGVALSIVIGSAEGWEHVPVEVDITRVVDAEGEPHARNITYTPEYLAYLDAGTDGPFEGPRIRTRTFRYYVAAMRVGAPAPLAESSTGRRGCGCIEFLDEDGRGTCHTCRPHDRAGDADTDEG